MYKSRTKIVSKFVEKLLTLYFVIPGINIGTKYQINRMIRSHENLLLKSKKIDMFKMDVRTFL